MNRQKLVSRETLSPSHQARGDKPRNLSIVGVDVVDRRDYSDNPSPYSRGKGISSLDFERPNYPLLIPNSKLGRNTEEGLQILKVVDARSRVVGELVVNQYLLNFTLDQHDTFYFEAIVRIIHSLPR
jgi:hypothetical protein